MSEVGAVFGGLRKDPQHQSFPNSKNLRGTKSNGELMWPNNNCPTMLQATVGEKRFRNGASKASSSEGVVPFSSEDILDVGGSEMKILKERKGRKKANDMFSNLSDLLPKKPCKADKSTIVDTAVKYIKYLEQTLQELIIKKKEHNKRADLPTAAMQTPQEHGLAIPNPNNNTLGVDLARSVSEHQYQYSFLTWSSPNVVLSIIEEEAHIIICTAKKPGLLTNIFCVLEKYGLELVSAQASSKFSRSLYVIHARLTGTIDRLPRPLIIEDIYKLAVGEILQLISTY